MIPPMNFNNVLVLSINRLSLVMNRYVNKRLRSAIGPEMKIYVFKILNTINNSSDGTITQQEYSRLGYDRSTLDRNAERLIVKKLCTKGEVPAKGRGVRKVRTTYKLTKKGRDLLCSSKKIIQEIDGEVQKMWDTAYAENISNRALYLLDLNKYGSGEKLPELNSSEHFASIINGLSECLENMKNPKKPRKIRTDTMKYAREEYRRERERGDW